MWQKSTKVAAFNAASAVAAADGGRSDAFAS